MTEEFRLLTREEIEAVPGMQDPIPGSLFAVGMVDEKGVAAACGVFLVVHVDPIWVREDLRLDGVSLRLWDATAKEIAWRRLGSEAFFSMSETVPGQPTEDKLAEEAGKFGAQELKARFFVIPIPEATDGLG
jgi:hypothetical protein